MHAERATCTLRRAALATPRRRSRSRAHRVRGPTRIDTRTHARTLTCTRAHAIRTDGHIWRAAAADERVRERRHGRARAVRGAGSELRPRPAAAHATRRAIRWPWHVLPGPELPLRRLHGHARLGVRPAVRELVRVLRRLSEEPLPRLRRLTSSAQRMCARREHFGKVGLPWGSLAQLAAGPGCPFHVRWGGLYVGAYQLQCDDSDSVARNLCRTPRLEPPDALVATGGRGVVGSDPNASRRERPFSGFTLQSVVRGPEGPGPARSGPQLEAGRRPSLRPAAMP